MRESVYFTPGPWRVEADPLHYGTLSTVIGGNKQREQSYLRDRLQVEVGGWAATVEQEANARLIASAPEMYEALRKAAETFRVYERLHLAKDTAEGRAKAEANAATAAMCEAVLAKAHGPISPQTLSNVEEN